MNKKLIKISSLALALALSLAACSGKSDKETDKSSKISQEDLQANKEEKVEVEKNPSENNEKLAKLYNKVLDEINSYKISGIEEGEFTYSYALVKTDQADYPQLLVAEETDFGISYLKLFTANDDFTDVFHDEDPISIGVASTGGFRGMLAQNADYNALIYTTFMSGTGEGQQEKITSSVEDDILKLEREVIWEGRIDTLAPDDSKEIEFFEIDDRDKLNDLAKIKDGEYIKSLDQAKDEKEESKENTDKSLEEKIKAERNAGNMVATGEVRVFNHNEMIAYQKLNPKMLPDMGEYYAVLILDKPMDVTMQSGGGGGDYTRNVGIIGLPEDMMDYDGQNITISFTNTDGHWQSDVSLPMDAPRMHQVKVLE